MAGRLTSGDGARWRAHPFLSAAIRIFVVLCPAALAAVAAVLSTRHLPPPPQVSAAAWWLVFISVGLVTWLVSVRVLDRLLPLAALLELTLVFPDAAPSRFAVLRRTANPRQLERDLRRAESEGAGTELGRRAQTILELIVALAVHDSRTRGHSERVRMFADLLGQEMRLPPADADRLRWAALLHDVGKLAVAREILNKPGRPDRAEWQVLHQHPAAGHRMIAPLHRWLGAWADAVLDHHERFDGSGYPRGLAGSRISLGGRIVAVADSYETMTAARPYKTAMGVAAARQELVRVSGSDFDPQVVRAFLGISLGRLWWTVGLGALFAELGILSPLSARFAHLGVQLTSGAAAALVAATAIMAGVATPPSERAAARTPTRAPGAVAVIPEPPPPSPSVRSLASPDPATTPVDGGTTALVVRRSPAGGGPGSAAAPASSPRPSGSPPSPAPTPPTSPSSSPCPVAQLAPSPAWAIDRACAALALVGSAQDRRTGT
jgi:HD domain